MGKNKTKRTGRYVTVGDSAYSFYDASTGINIVRGEKKFLTPRQLSVMKIKKALSSGHLVYAADDNKPVEKYNEEKVEQMKARFDSMVQQGMDAKKIASAFNLEQITKIADEYSINVEAEDTVETVVEAIIADIEGNGEGSEE